jgi:DNA-binding FrmR family transcriptional regulator
MSKLKVQNSKLDNKTLQNNNIKQQAKRRVNILKGQLDGLLRMIEKDEYCIDLLNQSSAIQNSLKSLDALILERHLKTHVVDQFKKERERAVKELLKVFKKIG